MGQSQVTVFEAGQSYTHDKTNMMTAEQRALSNTQIVISFSLIILTVMYHFISSRL